MYNVYITQTTYPVDLAMRLSLDNYYYNCFTLQMQEVDSKAAHYYAEVGTHVHVYLSSVSPRINEKGGDLAGARSTKLYLGAWCMYIYTPFIV